MTRKEWDTRKGIIRGFFMRLMVDMECALNAHFQADNPGEANYALGRLHAMNGAFGSFLLVTSVEYRGLDAWESLRAEDSDVRMAFQRWVSVHYARTMGNPLPRRLEHIDRLTKVWEPGPRARGWM